MKHYKAEYIWVDGTKPSALMRSNTKVLAADQEPPLWGFDGSSTNQAPGRSSDCVLQPAGIRHREMEHSEDLELIEIVAPGEFETVSEESTEGTSDTTA